MKKLSKVFSLVLGSVFALSLLTACGGGSDEPTAARICYDNLGAGFLSEADTKVVVEGALSEARPRQRDGGSHCRSFPLRPRISPYFPRNSPPFNAVFTQNTRG